MLNETIYLREGRDDVTLTTYILTDSRKNVRSEKRGAVLICPGGAYLACAETEQEPVALRFSSMGYHTFVLRYSTYGIDRNGFPDFSKGIPVNDESVFPNPLIDIAKAMLVIREHAEEWHIDTDKIAVCGFSAGAHNSAMFGVYWNNPIITDALNVKAEQLKPAALILGYPVIDLLQHARLFPKLNKGDQGLMMFFNVAYTGSEMPNEEILHRISPNYHVTEHTPPTFIWSTANDELAPPIHGTAMVSALATCGVPFEMHIFEDGPHGLSLADQSSAEFEGQIYPDVGEWVSLAERWLLKRFRLPEPPPRNFEWSAVIP